MNKKKTKEKKTKKNKQWKIWLFDLRCFLWNLYMTLATKKKKKTLVLRVLFNKKKKIPFYRFECVICLAAACCQLELFVFGYYYIVHNFFSTLASTSVFTVYPFFFRFFFFRFTNSFCHFVSHRIIIRIKTRVLYKLIFFHDIHLYAD